MRSPCCLFPIRIFIIVIILKLKIKLAEYLKSEVQLPDDVIEYFDSLWYYEELPKGHRLLSEGSRSRKIFYVEEGLLRLFYNKDGKDITHQFFSEGDLYVPIENIFLNQPFPFCLELLENCIVRAVDSSFIENELEKDVKFLSFSRNLAVSAIKKLSDQIHSLRFQSAQERYDILLKKHSNILLRAPLGHIASYLGITQSTLSVIRSDKAK